MKRWICVVFVLVLVGCSGVSSVPTQSQSVQDVMRRSGGAFSAKYAGSYSFTPCTFGHAGNFQFSGLGAGSFIHHSTESGDLTGMYNLGFCGWTGRAVLTSTLRTRNSITMQVTTGAYSESPCDATRRSVRISIVSGTGKFAHANGNGTMRLTCHSGGVYADRWSGTITF